MSKIVYNYGGQEYDFGELVQLVNRKINPQTSRTNYPCIELEHIEQFTGSLISYINSSEQKSIKNYFKKGHVLYGKLRPYLRKYYFAQFDGVCSTEIWVMDKRGPHITNEYIYYLIQTDKFNKYANVSSGSKMPRADWDYVQNIVFRVPEVETQKKIVNILTAWDRAIELKEKLLEQKKLQKKWLTHKLLMGRIRVNKLKALSLEELKEQNAIIAAGKTPLNYQKTNIGVIPLDWRVVEFSDFIRNVERKIDKPKEGYWRLGIRSHAKGTFHEFVNEPETVDMDELFIVKKNDLIVNITFAWEHAIAVANENDDGKLVSHRFPTYEFKDNADSMFFKYYVTQPLFKYMLKNISPGGAGRNRVMSKKDFLKLPVVSMPLKEQKEIAKILNIVDNEIKLLQNEIEQLRLQKKGLMQLLLTGKVRVAAD